MCLTLISVMQCIPMSPAVNRFCIIVLPLHNFELIIRRANKRSLLLIIKDTHLIYNIYIHGQNALYLNIHTKVHVIESTTSANYLDSLNNVLTPAMKTLELPSVCWWLLRFSAMTPIAPATSTKTATSGMVFITCAYV